jgi:riboflavin kinase/FMN adenylyltransferase
MTQIFHSLDQYQPTSEAIACTLGTLDGLHLGHQALIAATTAAAPYSVALTLGTHPSEVLQNKKVPLLCPLEQRLQLLCKTELDAVVVLDFTQELSEHPAASFLKLLHERIPFTQLLLGHDARFGKDRDGTPEVVRQTGEKIGFTVSYLEPVMLDGEPVSSTRIREALHSGDLSQVHALLGRPYSLYGPVIRGRRIGHSLGFPTANLAVDHLCLPPFGVYATRLRIEGEERWNPSVANLGFAPTVRLEDTPLLEAHLLEREVELEGKKVEVEFVAFLRPEEAFPSPEALRAQIALDVERARALFPTE